jgi:hypothetical protein
MVVLPLVPVMATAGARPEERAEVELGEAVQARAAGGEQPRVRLRETRAVDEQVVTRGLLGRTRGSPRARRR